MIGDGVNDVLSLKKSNLAVAMASGSQATRSVADIVLTDDSFAALAPAVQEGQRIDQRHVRHPEPVPGAHLDDGPDHPVLARHRAVSDPAAAGISITLFSVGIPAAMLAIWAQPGPQIRDSLGRTLLRFVLPAAIFSSVLGLTMFYGVLVMQMESYGDLASMTPAQAADVLRLSLPIAAVGAYCLPCVRGAGPRRVREPPTKWMAVVQEKSPDRRPTLLAIGLALAFIVLVVVEPLGDIFGLSTLPLPVWVIVIGLAALWFVILRYVWHWRLLERFVGA